MLTTAAFASPTRLPCAPWRLSGLVVGPLLNDPAALAALGDAVHQPPYKAPPQAPVLFIKPRNTLTDPMPPFRLPAGIDEVELGAQAAMVIGRTACRVAAADALEHVAAWMLVADLSVPHASFYRPSLRFKALDGSCVLGHAVPVPQLPSAGFEIDVRVDGETAQRASTARFTRPPAQLLADVCAFMTLRPGDVLLLGAAAGAPRLSAGAVARISVAGLPSLEFEVAR